MPGDTECVIRVRWRTIASPTALPALLAALPEAEQRRGNGMAPARLAAYVTGRALARRMLSEQLGVRDVDVPIQLDDERPTLPSDSGLWLSISHSGQVVGCAVARRPVGFDVEQLPNPPSDSLLRRTCTPAEVKRIQAAADPLAAFARTWVRKEAVAKASGVGLGLQLDRIDVRRPLVRVDAHGTWRVRNLTLGGMPAALAAHGAFWRSRVE